MRDFRRVSKLNWLCRRGMKELDVLLERFLERNRQGLLQGEWPELESLLEREDDCLWDWLQQPASAPLTRYRELLEKIRNDPSRSA